MASFVMNPHGGMLIEDGDWSAQSMPQPTVPAPWADTTVLGEHWDRHNQGPDRTKIDNLMSVIQSQDGLDDEPIIKRTAKSSRASRNNSRSKKTTCKCGNDSSLRKCNHKTPSRRRPKSDKVFACDVCSRTFSQRGNLKTHQRRHTGEKPFSCRQCGKLFAQKGNLNAHQVVHTKVKPFHCNLDGCQKGFTQLGNLKAHHNKFHSGTLDRLMSMRLEALSMTPEEAATIDQLTELYKNCNKGIKGRGKGCHISSGASSNMSVMTSTPEIDDLPSSAPMSRQSSGMSLPVKQEAMTPTSSFGGMPFSTPVHQQHMQQQQLACTPHIMDPSAMGAPFIPAFPADHVVSFPPTFPMGGNMPSYPLQQPSFGHDLGNYNAGMFNPFNVGHHVDQHYLEGF